MSRTEKAILAILDLAAFLVVLAGMIAIGENANHLTLAGILALTGFGIFLVVFAWAIFYDLIK